jgi:hypothetical protein
MHGFGVEAACLRDGPSRPAFPMTSPLGPDRPPRLDLHAQAAIDGDHLAGEIAGGGAGQVAD